MSLSSFVETILTSVAGVSVLQPCPHPPRRWKPRWWSWSFFGLAEKVCQAENDCFPLDVLARLESVDLFFPPESFSSFLAGLFPRRQLESMSQVIARDCSDAFASALTDFLTASFQKSRSLLWTSNWAQMEGLRSFRKYRIMISLLGVATGSNFWRTASRYSRCVA